MKNRRKQRSNNHGFTLVEIICAIAIFAMVMAAMGSIMVYTSKSYTRSSQETEIQQEAQFAANRIGGIVQDANEVTYSAGTLTMNDGVSVHTVSHNTGTSELMYAVSSGSTSSGDQLLASNVTSFDADVTDFDKTKTVKLNITINDDGREYQMSYNMKARNEAAKTAPASIVKTASIIAEPKLILVPGQTYTLATTVKGTTAGISAISSGLNVSVNADDSVNITVPVNTAKTGDSVFYVYLSTNELGDTGLPLDTEKVTVQVRRVNELKVKHEFVTTSGDEGKAGAEYKFTSNVSKSTPYLGKMLGVSWESGYEIPYAAEWSEEFTINDTSASFDAYFEKKDLVEDADKPTVTYKLKQDLPAGAKLTVKATSKHAKGVNKAHSNYDTVVAEDALVSSAPAMTSGSTIVVMEPGQTLEVPVTGLGTGALVSEVTDESDSSTSATYADGKVKIKLGKDEKDTVKVSIHPSGDTTNTFDVNVKVRRVEDITIDYNKISGDDFAAGTVYRFNTTYSGDNLAKASDDEEVTAYKNAYATEFSWEFNVGTSKKAEGAYIHNSYGSANSSAAYTGGTTNEYFDILNTGVNSYQPYIEVKLKKDFPTNGELVMTVKALHPLGNYASADFNKSGSTYATGIEDSCKITKDGLMASTKDGLVIAEPGQGVGKDVSGAFAIPIYVSSPIASIDAQLTGKKSSETSLYSATSGSGQGHKFNDKLWYIKMKIGSDETGSNGKMTLNLTAKNSSGTVLGTEEITIGLRRVTDVEIVSDGDINNKAGATIKLTAEATGYGKDGTEYFEQYTETDEGGNQPVWDRDDYVSPYPMEWTVISNGTEKPLSSYATITKTTYDSSKNQKYSNGNHQIEFTLAAALPNGSKIRATSRHAGGENKSGKKYEDVYGEIEVKGSGEDPGIGGIKRNDTPFRRAASLGGFFNDGGVDEKVSAMFVKQGYGNDYVNPGYDLQGHFLFRFSEDGTNWSQYISFIDDCEKQIMLEGYHGWGSSPYQGTTCFDPRKDIYLDVMYIVYDRNRKEIHWPWNNAVLTEGYGFKENGYKLSRFAQDNMNNYGATAESDFIVREFIPAADIHWVKNEALGQSDDTTHFFGQHYKESSPIKIGSNSGSSERKAFTIDAYNIALVHPESHQGHYKTVVQKKDSSGKWVDVTSQAYTGALGWAINGTTYWPSTDFVYDINYVYGAEGLYRFGILLEKWPYFEININSDKPIDPTKISLVTMLNGNNEHSKYVKTYEEDIPCYDWGTGYNVIYFKFQ